ncbi:MAG: hypothetical protein ING60_03980 [Rhodocyclaceae bacterium]|jgi:hypothetical protein|nr:hypothetical protein [Rhodocyclaceae bacterium]
MAFYLIDKLVTKGGFCFQAWDDRYSKGVWAALGTHETEVDCVRDLSSAGDLDMIPAMEYVFTAEWLPYVVGSTLSEAMQNLEDRLASLPAEQLEPHSKWRELVYGAISQLADTTRGRSFYGGKYPEKLPDLPATFEEAFAASIISRNE